ncbi:MAG: repressor LexA [Clostridia bacterium]|nr:repressor LexA [Clostridia bacterium]MBQ6426671.1 repressor LexA [Clostridia bacterium]MBR0445496.1 repressor LexA [Clostridia bacterium]
MGKMKESCCELLENYLNSYREKYKMTPSIRQIERDTGIPNSTVSRYLLYMEREGRIEYAGGRRNILTKQAKKTSDRTVSVPVVGSIACGIPILAEENIEEYVSLPESVFGTGRFFILHAAGDSMTGAGIDDGDLVVIRQQSSAEPGQIVVALIGKQDATLKRYRPDPVTGRTALLPANDRYNPITVGPDEELTIQGVAVKIIKDPK